MSQESYHNLPKKRSHHRKSAPKVDFDALDKTQIDQLFVRKTIAKRKRPPKSSLLDLSVPIQYDEDEPVVVFQAPPQDDDVVVVGHPPAPPEDDEEDDEDDIEPVPAKQPRKRKPIPVIIPIVREDGEYVNQEGPQKESREDELEVEGEGEAEDDEGDDYEDMIIPATQLDDDDNGDASKKNRPGYSGYVRKRRPQFIFDRKKRTTALGKRREALLAGLRNLEIATGSAYFLCIISNNGRVNLPHKCYESTAFKDFACGKLIADRCQTVAKHMKEPSYINHIMSLSGHGGGNDCNNHLSQSQLL